MRSHHDRPWNFNGLHLDFEPRSQIPGMTHKIQLKFDSSSHITFPPWEKLLCTSMPPTVGVRGDRGLLKLKPHKNPVPQVAPVAFQMLHSQGWLAATMQIKNTSITTEASIRQCCSRQDDWLYCSRTPGSCTHLGLYVTGRVSWQLMLR